MVDGLIILIWKIKSLNLIDLDNLGIFLIKWRF